MHAGYSVERRGKSSGCLKAEAAFGKTTFRLQTTVSIMKVVRFREKEAVKFVTPSGVTAFVATSLPPSLIKALKKKLQRKLKRQELRKRPANPS